MPLPDQFVYLEKIDPSILQDIKYFSHDNFIGRPIRGYQAARCILTLPTAIALSKIQKKIQQQSLSLKVFDSYRPQTAVNEFIEWAKDTSDQKMKASFYPHVNKADFFEQGYIAAERSSHSRGSTVDLTLVRIESNQKNNELVMGTSFDFMDESSHFHSAEVSQEARNNRLLLRELMETDFIPYDVEWWHFTLKNEPFPDQYFDFSII